MTKKLKVGVVGCGLVAQVMHLHYLTELSSLFELYAICDISATVRTACAETYGVSRTFAEWKDLLAEPIDAVFILSSGSHAPIAIAAAEAGLHVFVEKPMCFSVAEGRAMIAAAEKAGTILMVGYNKRYDPAYQRALQERSELRDLRLIKITTLESPFLPYVQPYPLIKGGDIAEETLSLLRADSSQRLRAAVGDVDDISMRAYHLILLDSMVHEFNTLRGIMGEPDILEFADVQPNCVTVILGFGETKCVVTWVDLPGIARYQMEFAFYGPSRRMTLSFPSPFVRNLPTVLSLEGGEDGGSRAWETREVTSYQESFKEELNQFHRSVVTGEVPATSGEDGLRDVALCEAVIAVHTGRVPRPHPTDWERRARDE
jgi:predicted dehydrogenase